MSLAWLSFVVRIGPLVVAAVHAVERVVKAAHGKDKQDAAVDLVGTMLTAAEGIASRDLLNDAKVQEALRHAINALVALENAVAAAREARQP